MSYTRTAIATATIVISLAATAPGTQPAATAAGLAGSTPAQDWTSPHRLALQAPLVQETHAPMFATTVIAETEEQAETAEWALEQMAAAGFELPPVTIYMHSDRADCSSDPNRVLNGYFVQIEGENIVHSCGNSWTLLHELTHVWDLNVMTDEARHEIMEHQGVDAWRHGTWNEAGGEHLASIVAWAIEGTQPTRIGYYDRDHLAEAYEMVTGNKAPILVGAGPVANTPRSVVDAVFASSTIGEPPQ